MAKKIKPLDLSATAVWDSNPLFTESETSLISKEAAAELREIQQTFGIDVVIPRVVAGEILFRKNWRLTILRNEAAKKLAVLGELVDSAQPDICDQRRLRTQLQRRFITWCREHRVKLWRIPFDKVNWRRLASLALSREPPFSPFDPKGKSEKGFRDALILETLCDVHESIAPKRTVFICGDELLANAATARLGNDRLVVYKTSSEYLSYLKLQHKNFVDAAIKAILEEAMAMFYSPESLECVYTKFEVPIKLHSTLPAEFMKMPSSSSLLQALPPETFTPATTEGYRIGATNIEAAENQQIIFKTELAAAQTFQSSNQFMLEQLRIIAVIVLWSANVQLPPEIELSSPQFRSITLEGTSFEVATDDRLKSFNLPTRLDRLVASFKSRPPAESD